MSAYEKSLTQVERPADCLAPLRQYLDESSQVTTAQIIWLKQMERFLPPSEIEKYDQQIGAQIAENVEAASGYLVTLAEYGMPVSVLVGDERLPLRGFAYDPDDGGYFAGVHLPEGPALLPLYGSFDALEV